jgi:hypothetical protein
MSIQRSTAAYQRQAGLRSELNAKRQPRRRLPRVLRCALAQLAAGVDPDEIAAELIRQSAEAALFRVRLAVEDPRQGRLMVLMRALRGRTFDADLGCWMLGAEAVEGFGGRRKDVYSQPQIPP